MSLFVVKYLVEQGADKETKDNNGSTAMIRAAQYDRVDVIRYLIMQGTDTEAKDISGSTALMRAASGCRLKAIHYLVEQRADTSCLDNNGNSVLMHLQLSDNTIKEDNILPTVKLLLDHGAPSLQSNKQGITAKSIARRKKFKDVMDLLEEYAAKHQREQEREDPTWFISRVEIKTGATVAHGGFGSVSMANWAGNPVVMKEISVAEIRHFLKEVNTWRNLTHVNVVLFYGANHREEPYFIVSKYASNGELIDYLKREKKEGRTVVCRKLREVAAGLSYLHSKGVVHGDLRGNNIVMSDNGTAMLTDFGLSFSESGSCSLMKMKDTLGVMQWRAPELAMLTVETPTHKSDIFSLGMCIIEAVKGAIPWGENLSSDEIRQIYRNGNFKIDKPAELTDVQWNLVKKMIAISPGDRPDLVEVVSALERSADDEKEKELDKECPY